MSTEKTRERMDTIRRTDAFHRQAIHNVYELPSVEQTIRYLHAAAGFPTKATGLAAIRRHNYSSWPMVTVKAVHKFFPESEETQEGHMRQL